VIGFLSPQSAEIDYKNVTVPFLQGLKETGYVEGQNVTVEHRWAENQYDRLPALAADLVRRRVAVIVTSATAAALAAKLATMTIPIVFALAVDPVGGGLVASLARPGGNVTGLSFQGTDSAGKRLELLREVVPRLRRLAIIADVGFPQAELEMGEVQATARTLGIEVAPLEIRRAEDIAPVFEAQARVDALYVVVNALVVANRTRVITLALGARLPTIFNTREFVHAGGLMSYGPNYPDLFRRTAELVDKILRGTNPGDIPVEQPTKFEFVLNLTTAKALGLVIPESFLLRADEVIE